MAAFSPFDPDVQEVLDDFVAHGQQFRISESGAWLALRGGRWVRIDDPTNQHHDPATVMMLGQHIMQRKVDRQTDAAQAARASQMFEQQRHAQTQAQQQAAAAAPATTPDVEPDEPGVTESPVNPQARRGRRSRQWGAGLAAGFGATMAMGAGLAMSLTPPIAETLSIATSFLGGTGTAVTQTGMNLVNYLGRSLTAASYIGGGIIGMALAPVMGAGVGYAAGFVVSQIGTLFGGVGQVFASALSGVRGIFKDINDLGKQTADTIMGIAYAANLGAEGVMRLTQGMQAAGVPLGTIRQLFGSWSGREEVMGPRLAMLGVDYQEAQRRGNLMSQLQAGMMGMPEMMRLPMLQGALGAQAGEALYPILNRPRGQILESENYARRWGVDPETLRNMQQNLQATEERVGFLGDALRLKLLEGFLPIMQHGLERLTSWWDKNHDAAIKFLTVTAPDKFLAGIDAGLTVLEAVWPKLKQGAEDFLGILRFIHSTVESINKLLDRLHIGGTPGTAGGPRKGMPGGMPGTTWQPGDDPATANASTDGSGWGRTAAWGAVALGLSMIPHALRWLPGFAIREIGALGGIRGIAGRIHGIARGLSRVPVLGSAIGGAAIGYYGAGAGGNTWYGQAAAGLGSVAAGAGFGALLGGQLGAVVGGTAALGGGLWRLGSETLGLRRRSAATDAEMARMQAMGLDYARDASGLTPRQRAQRDAGIPVTGQMMDERMRAAAARLGVSGPIGMSASGRAGEQGLFGTLHEEIRRLRAALHDNTQKKDDKLKVEVEVGVKGTDNLVQVTAERAAANMVGNVWRDVQASMA